MPNDIQAAAERYRQYTRGESNQAPCYRAEDQVDLADYGAKAATLIPQLVAALKSIRATAERQQRNRLAGMYGWKTETIDKCVEDNELIQQLDAAIAAGEGRDAERS